MPTNFHEICQGPRENCSDLPQALPLNLWIWKSDQSYRLPLRNEACKQVLYQFMLVPDQWLNSQVGWSGAKGQNWSTMNTGIISKCVTQYIIVPNQQLMMAMLIYVTLYSIYCDDKCGKNCSKAKNHRYHRHHHHHNHQHDQCQPAAKTAHVATCKFRHILMPLARK